MKGTLTEAALPALLRELHVGRRSGLLHLTSPDAERRLHLRAGHLVGLDSSLEEERLDTALVHAGVASPVDASQAAELAATDGRTFFEALSALGLEQARLLPVLAEQARVLLLRAFAGGEGHYEFEAAAGPGDGKPAGVPLGELVLQVVQRLSDPDVVRFGLGDIDRIPALSSDPLLRFQRLTLSPADGFVMSRIDGTLSAREVVQTTPLEAEQVLRSLLGLLSAGVIEYLPLPPKKSARPAGPPTPVLGRPAPAKPAGPPIDPAMAKRRQEVVDAYAALERANHFEVLRIARGANDADVKAAYFSLAKRFHPDTHHDPALADLREKLEKIFIRVGAAYDVLKNPRTRADYESRLPRVVLNSPVTPASGGPPPPGAPAAGAPDTPPPPAINAEVAIREAERHISAQKFWDAIQALEQALPHATGRTRSRARLLLARTLLRNPHWHKRAEEVLLEAVHDDAQYAEPYFVLAGIYKEKGLRARATSMLRKVLELKPEHEEAAALLAELAPVVEPGPAEAPKKAGLLHKLFGRKDEGGGTPSGA